MSYNIVHNGKWHEPNYVFIMFFYDIILLQRLLKNFKQISIEPNVYPYGFPCGIDEKL